MTRRQYSNIAAISAAQLICTAAAVAAQAVNPEAEVLKAFTDRTKQYIALQKKIESTLPALKQTNEPGKIDAHIDVLAAGIRTARADAKTGDIFGAAADHIRGLIKDDARNRSMRDAYASMEEVPRKEPLRVNSDYPEKKALATVPPLLLKRLPLLPEGLEYRFMGRDLILRDVKANLVVDFIREAVPTVKVKRPPTVRR